MKILNFGSINIDHVYQVDDFVLPGETKRSLGFQMFPGGKGLNQSIAMARAGAKVYHGGKIGQDGQWLIELMRASGVETGFIEITEGDTGRAIIQVNAQGQNGILLHDGANQKMDVTYIDRVLQNFHAGDMLVLQNEINLISYIIDRASERGMKIALNPSPANEIIYDCDLSKITWLLLNEIEGEWLTGEKSAEKIVEKLILKYPKMEVVLTLGSEGCLYKTSEKCLYQHAFKAKAVDTTGAGDTFTGYFLNAAASGNTVEEALARASLAASISVTRPGAALSIPYSNEVNLEKGIV